MPAFHLPVLAITAVIFALVVAATAKNVHLGLAALLGGIAFALLRGISPAATILASVKAILDPDTILLFALVTSIMVLSAAMKNSGALDAFTRAVAYVAPSSRASLTLTPLLIGTLPMPGGAILSAPLVDALDPERKQGADGLSVINYWFRHVLELFWPLYPSFILTCTVAGLSSSRLSLLNLYAPVVLVGLGQLFIIRGRALPAPAEARKANRRGLKSLVGFLPLAILLGVYLLLDPLVRSLVPALRLEASVAALLVRYLPIFGGVAAGSIFVALRGGGPSAYKGTLNASVLSLVGVIAGIRVFSALLEAGGIAQAGASELAAWGIPAVAVAVILPFITGLVTGVGFAYVGIAFPIVLSLFPTGGAFPPEAAIVLAGAFGFAGMMLSPLHVCMVVTAGHFGTRLAPMLRRFALPLLVYLGIACLYVVFLANILR